MDSAQRALLIDFGSTFTKVVAVDLAACELLGRAAAPTTVREDIMIGLDEALRRLADDYGLAAESFGVRIAASSAAGGLKMAAIGLVPDLTVEAARRAALGAGARLLAGFAYELTSADVERLIALAPDIVLLAGGTDGGNQDILLRNAQHLAESNLTAPILLAGNRNAADRAAQTLRQSGKEVRVSANVMPELNVLQVEPAREAIRAIFMERIIHAKGLDKAEAFVRDLLMPTPAAVLRAAELLAKGLPGEPGLGDLLVVDIGGATTDVHSLGAGEPTKPGVAWKGLPEPFAKRTVEGDLGVRVSARSLWEAVGSRRIAETYERLGFGTADATALEEIVAGLPAAPDTLPNNEALQRLDTVLANVACETAVARHVGYLETHYTPFGASYVQFGKDLTPVTAVIGTGGPLIHAPDPAAILRAALFGTAQPQLLRPLNPRLCIDNEYILSAMGLLAGDYPLQALRLMKRHLVDVDRQLDR